MTTSQTFPSDEVSLHRIPHEMIAVIDRARKDMGDLSDLAEDIKANGQLQPGIVRPATLDDQPEVDPLATPWVLVAGGRRFAASALAGLDYFLAIDRGELPPLQAKIWELAENLKRKNFEWAEEVQLKKEIHELQMMLAGERGETWTQADTAKFIGETPANISRDLAIAREIEVNPDLKSIGSKKGAVRAVEYERKVSERTARVNQTNLLRVKDKLKTMDMRDFIRTLPENSVDLTFTDFPFGIDYAFADGDRNTYEDSQDTLEDLLTDIIPQMMRVTKPTGWLALMMGSTNYPILKDLVENCCTVHYEYRHPGFKACKGDRSSDDRPCNFVYAEDPEWIWYRPNSRNPSMHPELHRQNQYEKICVVNMGQGVLIRKNLGNVLMHDAVYSDRIHEMQRPPALCEDIITSLTVGGERVADFCFGSGQHLASAARLQRDFLGCDINPKNLDPAVMLVTEHFEHPAVGA